MGKLLLLIASFLVPPLQMAPAGWDIFASTRFELKYVEEMGVQAEVPTFDKEIKSLEGTEVTLTGYYLPFNVSKRSIILSRLPNASCFFCGGAAGQESVAQIYFKEAHPQFKLDELVRVKGLLLLNSGLDGNLVFKLVNAEVVKREG